MLEVGQVAGPHHEEVRIAALGFRRDRQPRGTRLEKKGFDMKIQIVDGGPV